MPSGLPEECCPHFQIVGLLGHSAPVLFLSLHPTLYLSTSLFELVCSHIGVWLCFVLLFRFYFFNLKIVFIGDEYVYISADPYSWNYRQL